MKRTYTHRDRDLAFPDKTPLWGEFLVKGHLSGMSAFASDPSEETHRLTTCKFLVLSTLMLKAQTVTPHNVILITHPQG